MDQKKITIPDLIKMKQAGTPIAMLTAYDYPMALILDSAGVDCILVGDSVGNVVLGYESTVPVTMDEMVHHTKAARKGVNHALLVADMPFMSFNISREQTITNAGRLVKEAGADAVKMEGAGEGVITMIRAVVGAGIPVMGHIGLTPQTATMLGGLKVQGKTGQAAQQIMRQALELEQAGCFGIVFECIPDVLAEHISRALKIPSIGIGAGAGCDGQVLVTHDMVGITERFVPKFVKRYAQAAQIMREAAEHYVADVRGKTFPDSAHSFTMKPEDLKGLEP
ncbi:MAG: 3-methyl-2-oxobutanoate hydroxymethyltransferase [Candidatus Omnitrophica bacterium]|jgi:ketopantoate hydroxymethyltransferase (EC 2.1.2.11)|nr:3-methyl-2-oxobutanoate hydroxymethyltransferase [Candidatus Omnitrophota bacterium]